MPEPRLQSRTRMAAMAVCAMLLAACQGGGVPAGLPGPQPAAPALPQTLPPATGETLGQGAVRLALFLPLGAEGNGSRIAAEFRNAAQMAIEDVGGAALEIVVKDTAGTPEGAARVAAEAVREGAAAALGPVFAGNVRAAADILRDAGRPVIAFSSDRSVAGGGVYLNSFQPEGLVERTLAYAAMQGYRDVVAIVPNGTAGDIAIAEARRTLTLHGGALVAAARYDYDNASVSVAVQQVSAALENADAIFIPDGGNSPNAIMAALAGTGVDLSGKKLLGTGQWTSSNLRDPALAGAWFADTDQTVLAGFRQRYAARFGEEPAASSALAYDTVVLAANVVAAQGAAGFRRDVLEAPSGFAGYAGIFRFRADGTAERGYAVYEVTDGAPRMISPAPRSFDGAG